MTAIKEIKSLKNSLSSLKSSGLNFWFRFSLFNLILVAVYGTLMRYKIGFEFPYFSQKFLLHAHSHFAFTGWVTHTIIVLMTGFLINHATHVKTGFYKWLIIVNLICAYSMLISFTIQGYGYVSIFFSTASVFTVYLFAWQYFRDLKHVASDQPAKNWFKAALAFYILSSLGTFYLAYMIASKNINQHIYLGAIYFFLHFQYNGWFFFACMGLMLNKIKSFVPTFKSDNAIFLLFMISCIPTYLLSILWANLPVWLYTITVIAAFVQAFAMIKLIWHVKKIYPQIKDKLTVFVRYLLLFVMLCLCLKLFLQLISIIPAVSKYAFGIRPIVIAYLHLILLAIISLFLIAYLYTTKQIVTGRFTVAAAIVFIIGVILNEFFLLLQGLIPFTDIMITGLNEMLFIAATVILAGSILLFLSQFRSKKIQS